MSRQIAHALTTVDVSNKLALLNRVESRVRAHAAAYAATGHQPEADMLINLADAVDGVGEAYGNATPDPQEKADGIRSATRALRRFVATGSLPHCPAT